jgi:hypothetical protein
VKKLNCFCIFILVTLVTKAQSITLIGGFQNPTISPSFIVYPDTLRKTSTQKTGVTIGITTDLALTEKLSFQTGVLFSTTGSNWTQFYDTTNLYESTKHLARDKNFKNLSTNTTLHLEYINVPVNLSLKLPIKGKTSFVVGGGPQFSLFFNGNTNALTIQVAQDSAKQEMARISTKNVENNDLPIGKLTGRYRIVHVGLNAFAGLDFGKVSLVFHQNTDLTEFYEEADRKYKAKAWGIRLGIAIGQRKQ